MSSLFQSIIISSWFCLIWVISIIGLQAQTVKLQVVTKTIEKEFLWEDGEIVIIEGEKANFKVQNWSGSTVKVILKQIAKSPNRAIAEKELVYQKFILEKRKTGIRIKNYFVIPKNVSKTESILKSEYEIWLPKECPMELINSYGNISLESITGKLSVDNKYGNIIVNKLQADLSIKSYFGDLTMREFTGTLSGVCNHTLINLEKVSGKISLKTTLGDVFINDVSSLAKLEIDASKADVTLQNIDWKNADIKLYSKYGDTIVPNSQEKYFTKYSEVERKFEKPNKSAKQRIEINTSFGKIVAE
ncbi:MAG: hypothetical protein ACI85I_001178 [Arenicella sp.]|jgi:hypothetical protein